MIEWNIGNDDAGGKMLFALTNTALHYFCFYSGILGFVGVIVVNYGVLLLLGLIAISMIGFILYNQLICYNPISEIAIFNALIPMFGTIMSCIMLGEKMGLNTLIGLLLVSAGIFILHFKPKMKKK